MKFVKLFFILLNLIGITACKTNKKDPIKSIEQAHQKDAFLSNKAVQFNLVVKFRGRNRLNANITLLTNSSQCKIENSDGSKIYTNNECVYYSPDFKNPKNVRFDAYTWAYFFLFPYKLNDPGTQWSNFGETQLNGDVYDTQKLTFETGTGDAPDDWYFVYSDQDNNLIHTAAYIVTYGKTLKKAESDPHAIRFSNYQKINNIPLATNWTFWEWNKSDGTYNQLGEANLSNIKFVNITNDTFIAPDHYIEKIK